LYYLLQFLKPVFESLIPRSSKYKEINASAIQAFKIPVPPLKKQKEIAKKCNEIDGSVAKILEGGVALKNIDQLRDKPRHSCRGRIARTA